MNKIKNILGWVIAIFGVVLMIYTRFTHIDVTETRLLVDHWLTWFVVYMCFLVGGFLAAKK